jgi:hypothetical protein
MVSKGSKSNPLKSKASAKISAPGKEPITFKPGGLHESLNVPAGKPNPNAKMAAAAEGKYGAKAQRQANFAQGALAAGRKTAAKNRKTK